MSIGTHAFNQSLCLFEPKNMKAVLPGFNFTLLVDIHSFTSLKHLFNCSKADRHSSETNAHKLRFHQHKIRA